MEQFLYQYKKNKVLKNAVLLFPNSYFIGMSALGFQSVYHYLQSDPQIHCERAFIEQENQKILTLESRREIFLFDAVFITISFETDLIRLLRGFASSGIAPRKGGPLIVVGGIAATILPLYLKEIADIIVSGDASAVLPPILEAIKSDKKKEEIIRSMDGKPGIYTASSIQTETIGYYTDVERNTPEHTVILSDRTEFSGRGLIEVSRSCLFHCAFCLVTKAYGKYRPFPAESILESAAGFQGLTDKIGLVAATLTNHTDFKKIIRELNRSGFKLSFSAFRVEDLDDELLNLIIENENKTLVIAPETASPVLKKKIRKQIPDETIYQAVEKACESGIKRLKLYFLIGIPGETNIDLDRNIEFIRNIRDITMKRARKFGYTPEIIADFNPLVPKPLTIFQGMEMEDIKVLKQKILYLKNKIHGLGRVFMTGESPKHAGIQYLLANHKLPFEELQSIK